METAFHHIASLEKAHALQRYQLEIALDSIPRDSRYSNELVELMRREEMSPSQDMATKVNQSLRNETRQFFKAVVQQNIKKWIALMQKFDRERAKAKSTLDVHPSLARSASPMPSTSPTAGKSPVGSRKVPTAEELILESNRLEEDYNEHWYVYENFSLEEAFRSQLKRIETDWAVHEKAAVEEYTKVCEQWNVPPQLLSVYGLDHADNDMAAGNTQLWQHPEKQKTLIHTAPVLAPQTSTSQRPNTSGGTVGTIRAIRKQHGQPSQQAQAEIEKAAQKFRTVMDQLRHQRSHAMRWMHRQEIRLTAQCDELQAERKSIAALMRRERQEFSTLRALIGNPTTHS